MLDRSRASRRAIARGALIASVVTAAVIVAFVWSENVIAHSFHACVSKEASHQSSNDPDKSRFIIGRFLEREAVCTVRLLDAHNGLVTAFAGLAVAAFTLTLKWSTDRLWKAADDALKTTERAFVFIDGFDTQIFTGTDFPIKIENVPERYRDRLGLLLTRFAVQPRWKNGGTTPTKEMFIQVNWGNFPPLEFPLTEEQRYRGDVVSFFIAPHAVEGSGFIEMPTASGLIEFHAFSSRRGPIPHIFIWGRADYSDVFNAKHFIEWQYELSFRVHEGKLRADFTQWGDYNRSDET